LLDRDKYTDEEDAVMRSLLQALRPGEMFLLLVTLAAAFLLLPLASPAPVRFSSLKEFREFAKKMGLFFHSGSVQPLIQADNCYFADHAVSFEEVSVLSKQECGMTAAWRGIVWVVRYSNAFSQFEFSSIGGHHRLWGNIAAAGDAQLLDRIEEIFRQ
jgi:hypothetical protein